MNPAVGIDLGTTNTVVAVQTDATGPRLLYIPQPVEQRYRLEEKDHIKSAVLFESADSAVVGAFAAHRLDAFRSIKSKMGTRWRACHPCSTSIRLTPTYISAHILGLAYQALVKEFPEWDKAAIVTVPASFNSDQRHDTLLAAQIAGFRGVRLMDEPSAAFYYHFDQYRESLPLERPEYILVFDLGGGTLDVSIIELQKSGEGVQIDAIGRSRYNNLGGDDIDLDLAVFILACWEYSTGNEIESLPANVRKYLYKLVNEKAEAFKQEAEDYIANDLDLNEFVLQDEIKVNSHSLLLEYRRTLSRALYDEITGRYFQDKNDINIFRPIGQALSVAQQIRPGFQKEQLSRVLYTGGASRMAAVKASLRGYFAPVTPYPISDEDACNTVALGAASCRYDQRHRKTQVVMTNRLLESILTRTEDGSRYIPVVPMTCEPSDVFTDVPDEFSTHRDIIRLRMPLFRGTGPTDHQLSPMADLQVDLDKIVPEGTKYWLSYRMNKNKTVELKVMFDIPEGPVRKTAEVCLGASGQVDATSVPLCRINALRA